MFVIRPKFTYKFQNSKYIQYRLISDADILKSIKTTKMADRESRFDSQIKTLIPLMNQGKFTEVAQIIKTNNININAHDKNENTLLTHAASVGDLNAIKFLVRDMGANLHASCACPHHKTALHYASENGHYNVVQFLLNSGALPNEMDSRKYTALDVASTEDIKKLLILKTSLVPA